MPEEENVELGEAFAANEAIMTSDEARQHFIDALIAQHLANEKMRLLAQARIKEDMSPQLVDAVQELTPEQVKNMLNTILVTRPSLLEDLERFLEARGPKGQLQVASDEVKADVNLTRDERGRHHKQRGS